MGGSDGRKLIIDARTDLKGPLDFKRSFEKQVFGTGLIFPRTIGAACSLLLVYGAVSVSKGNERVQDSRRMENMLDLDLHLLTVVLIIPRQSNKQHRASPVVVFTHFQLAP